ncbi:oxygenase MpaB family protein [Massilia sp. YIM B02763]|uniref:oxygenase MpaB family protein n=1 Tax=Massilia sp. YIM B02763 TaxID=3050130 RepID=UPI0025B6AA8F|nr:oxygenase MpaB family protein [Massilia sp. YIM B02763]MDN4055079.1 oxygenase MpaB family protein [Massilia sp. YIM B02763]
MFGTIRNLLRPPPGMAFDFSQPAGEPALAPAGGVSWRVFANPVALFVGGVAAVLLELAEPSVRAGVWDHSGFRRDPALRLRRTGFAAMMTVYGPRSASEALIARVVRMHDRVQGNTPDGVAYRANDPRLLDWVQATATFGFSEAYHAYVRPLSAAERDAAFAEGQPAARLYGATGAPRSRAEWEALLAATAPGLEGSAILSDFMRIMAAAPILPRPLRWLQRLLVRAAVEIVPEPVRSLPQLRGRGLRPGEALLVRVLARVAGLLPLGDTPPAQAARRLRGTGPGRCNAAD